MPHFAETPLNEKKIIDSLPHSTRGKISFYWDLYTVIRKGELPTIASGQTAKRTIEGLVGLDLLMHLSLIQQSVGLQRQKES